MCAFYELEAGRHVPPERAWSVWLCADHLVTGRREVMRQFAGGIGAAGRQVPHAFLVSVRAWARAWPSTATRGGTLPLVLSVTRL